MGWAWATHILPACCLRISSAACICRRIVHRARGYQIEDCSAACAAARIPPVSAAPPPPIVRTPASTDASPVPIPVLRHYVGRYLETWVLPPMSSAMPRNTNHDSLTWRQQYDHVPLPPHGPSRAPLLPAHSSRQPTASATMQVCSAMSLHNTRSS